MRIWQDLGPCQGMAGATTGATYRMSERDIDQQLVSRAQRGDKRAFDFLVNKYQRRLARLLSRFIRDPAEIEDALLSPVRQPASSTSASACLWRSSLQAPFTIRWFFSRITGSPSGQASDSSFGR